ncbi:MAG: FAD-binding protein [Nitrospinaceae bacterium]|nr:FAD-binding protein [Nitrospinaceae bacterium]
MQWAQELLKKVEATRSVRLEQPAPVLDSVQEGALLKQYHPDYLGHERKLAVGPNAGEEKFPLELAELLEGDSSLEPDTTPKVDIETDVLILGGGGAGATAALTLAESGLSVHLATKLRLGDSNTVMAEGGIQSALAENDSARRHFADALVGGHGENDPELLRILCEQGPESIRWLSQLGCLFEQNEDGRFRLRAGGGTSVPRVLACRDYTGLEIMRVLKDAVRLTGTHILEEHVAVELLDDGAGQVTGAILFDRIAGKRICVSARAVILATGGSGQIRLQGFPTSNHVGATGDGLVLAYRQGCRLIHLDSYQYHPSGACYPEALAGQLVTEAIRSIGAQVVNAEGVHFINEMAYRDVLAGAIIKEIAEGRGVKTPHGKTGVWLDTPMIDLKNGAGTLARQFPGLIHRFERYAIDPTKTPILIYPTLHYQNGGIRVDTQCRTDRVGLWACGEVTGGLHGKNRLMGNSLLDITVFGRRAAESVLGNLPERGASTLTNLERFRSEREKVEGLAQTRSPQFFPEASGMKLESCAVEEAPKEEAASQSFEPPNPFNF